MIPPNYLLVLVALIHVISILILRKQLMMLIILPLIEQLLHILKILRVGLLHNLVLLRGDHGA